MDIVCPQLPCSSGFFNLKITMQTQITFCLCMHQHHRIPFWKTCQLNCLLTLLEFSLTKICHRQIKFLQWFDIRHWFSNLTHSFNSHVFSLEKISDLIEISKSQKQILKFSFEPKNKQKYFCISALASKKRSNQKK